MSGTAALVLFRDFSGLQAVWWGMPGDLGVLGEFWVLDVFVESVWACTPEDLAQTPDTKVPLQECKVTPSGPRCWLGDVGWLKLFLDLCKKRKGSQLASRRGAFLLAKPEGDGGPPAPLRMV